MFLQYTKIKEHIKDCIITSPKDTTLQLQTKVA
jgi:hypothetical protein